MATAVTERVLAAGTADAEPRILVADPIASDGLEELKLIGAVDVAVGASPEELLDRIAGCDALVVRSETKVTEALLEAVARSGLLAAPEWGWTISISMRRPDGVFWS